MSKSKKSLVYPGFWNTSTGLSIAQSGCYLRLGLVARWERPCRCWIQRCLCRGRGSRGSGCGGCRLLCCFLGAGLLRNRTLSSGLLRRSLLRGSLLRCGLFRSSLFRCSFLGSGLLRCSFLRSSLLRCGLLGSSLLRCSFLCRSLLGRCSLLRCYLLRCCLLSGGFLGRGGLFRSCHNDLLDQVAKGSELLVAAQRSTARWSAEEREPFSGSPSAVNGVTSWAAL
jgi:hypothetical protein